MILRLVCASVLILSAADIGQNPREQSILVTVLDQAGAPVKDAQPADLAVSEDGAVREVTAVKPAADPLTIALLIDTTTPTMGTDAPTQQLRAGLLAFVKAIQGASPESQIGMWEFAGAGVQTVKFTAKTDDLTKKIQRMFPTRQSGGVLLEALVDASKELGKRPGHRRVVVLGELQLARGEHDRAEARGGGRRQGRRELLGGLDSVQRQRVDQFPGEHADPGGHPRQCDQEDRRPAPHRCVGNCARGAVEQHRCGAVVAVPESPTSGPTAHPSPNGSMRSRSAGRGC